MSFNGRQKLLKHIQIHYQDSKQTFDVFQTFLANIKEANQSMAQADEVSDDLNFFDEIKNAKDSTPVLARKRDLIYQMVSLLESRANTF